MMKINNTNTKNFAIIFALILPVLMFKFGGGSFLANVSGILKAPSVKAQKEFPFKGHFKKDELLVKFKDKERARSTINSLGVEAKAITKTGAYKVKVPRNKTLAGTYSEIVSNPDVSYVEPNYIVKLQATPSDTYYSSQNTYLSKVKVAEGWDQTTGNSSTRIAVIDTGVDPDHEDLISKIYTNSGDPVDGLDNDNNGYIDDNKGFDFCGTQNLEYDPYYGWYYNCSNDNYNPGTGKWTNDADSATDDQGHGTSVAGIAAASSNNSKGVAGMDWSAKIIPLKSLSQDGFGSISGLAEAIDYSETIGASIVNMSWGMYGYSQTIKDAIDNAYNGGLVLAAAAGNDDYNEILFPASLSNVLAVGAANSSDQRITSAVYGWGSNYGPELDVMAPGIYLYSTHYTGGYTSGFGGTSGATPHVAGLAGLIKAKFPALTNSQIYDHIRRSADDLGSSGFDNYYGHGRINAERALSLSLLMDPRTNLSNYAYWWDTAIPGNTTYRDEFFTQVVPNNSYIYSMLWDKAIPELWDSGFYYSYFWDHAVPDKIVAGYYYTRLWDKAVPELWKSGFYRSEERRVGKECRSRWSPYH